MSIPALLIRCRLSNVQVGETRRTWGCGRVWDGTRWRWADVLEAAQDGGICGSENGGADCLGRLREAQQRARRRLERRSELRAEAGYGPVPEGIDPFEGF